MISNFKEKSSTSFTLSVLACPAGRRTEAHPIHKNARGADSKMENARSRIGRKGVY
jgi:hypothetical protein